MTARKDDNYTYPQKIWIAGGILAFIAIIILLFRATFSVMLLSLAGTLIAVYFRGLSGYICRKTNWKEGACLATSIIGSLLLLIFVFWMIGAKFQAQVAALTETLPTTIENAKTYLQKSAIGKKIVEKISSPQTQKNIETTAGTLFKSTFGILGDIYVVLFIGIFFT